MQSLYGKIYGEIEMRCECEEMCNHKVSGKWYCLNCEREHPNPIYDSRGRVLQRWNRVHSGGIA